MRKRGRDGGVLKRCRIYMYCTQDVLSCHYRAIDSLQELLFTFHTTWEQLSALDQGEWSVGVVSMSTCKHWHTEDTSKRCTTPCYVHIAVP